MSEDIYEYDEDDEDIYDEDIPKDCACGCNDGQPYKETEEEFKNRSGRADDACRCVYCPCCEWCRCSKQGLKHRRNIIRRKEQS